jgi:hypothetical protein
MISVLSKFSLKTNGVLVGTVLLLSKIVPVYKMSLLSFGRNDDSLSLSSGNEICETFGGTTM